MNSDSDAPLLREEKLYFKNKIRFDFLLNHTNAYSIN